jgi:hypothetical protein
VQKNTSGQKIGAQMVSASDGSAFTGSVTVAVTIDAGTQATGSVGSGACTHEGNGYHTYAPSQAETNGKLIAFTFTGSGAVPATVQVFTRGFDASAAVVPANVTQFGGSAGTFASGRPEVNASHLAGSSVSTTAAQIGVNVVTAGGTAWATVLTNLVSSIWSATTRVLTAGTNIVLAKGTGVTGLTDLDAAGVRTAVGLTSANLDDQLGDLASAADLATVQGDITTLLGRLIALAVATGAVTSGTASATAFPTDLTETADGHWNDAFLVLTSGDLAGQVKRITGYDGTGKVVTVAGGFTGTPAEGDTFALVNR